MHASPHENAVAVAASAGAVPATPAGSGGGAILGALRPIRHSDHRNGSVAAAWCFREAAAAPRGQGVSGRTRRRRSGIRRGGAVVSAGQACSHLIFALAQLGYNDDVAKRMIRDRKISAAESPDDDNIPRRAFRQTQILAVDFRHSISATS